MSDKEKKEKTQAVRLVRAEPNAMVGTVISQAFEPEDEFKSLYIGTGGKGSVIEPPYNLKHLDRLCQENNALSPCVEAMVTNVEGTDYGFVRKDGKTNTPEDDANIEKLRSFFDEVWPGQSFTTIRKMKRRDEERVGNAYFEVIRNPNGKIIFMRHVDAKMMRIMELDDPVPVTISMMRDGVEASVRVMKRERRFAQFIGKGTYIYFKEFGASRDIDKNTGAWTAQGARLPADKRGTEIIHFTNLPDASSPYGVPKWVNQLPSVLGSRKAEEFNLDYFDNGGVPPVLIMVEGGVLSPETRTALTKKTSGIAAKNNRVQILETEPTGGSLDSASTVRVRVERFGSERSTDSMFENYDDKCEARVRRSFRLPPIFVGEAEGYNFATAHASYTVTEAQVFRPERDEFDEVITQKILPELGFNQYKFKSNPLTIEDVSNKLKGIEIGLNTNHLNPEDAIREINTSTGTDMRFSPTPVNPIAQVQSNTKPASVANQNGTPAGTNTPARAGAKKEDAGVLALAIDLMMAMRERDTDAILKNANLFATLTPDQQKAAHQTLAMLQLGDYDSDELTSIAACSVSVIADNLRESTN